MQKRQLTRAQATARNVRRKIRRLPIPKGPAQMPSKRFGSARAKLLRRYRKSPKRAPALALCHRWTWRQLSAPGRRRIGRLLKSHWRRHPKVPAPAVRRS